MFPGVSTVGAPPSVGPSPNLHSEPGPVPTLSPKLAKGVVKPDLGFRSSFSQRRTSAAVSLAPSLLNRLAISHHGAILSFFLCSPDCCSSCNIVHALGFWRTILWVPRYGKRCFRATELRVCKGCIVRWGKLERGIDWCILDVVEPFGAALQCEGLGRRVTSL